MKTTKIKIKKGDTVRVITGKDRGRTGKVLRAIPAERRVVVENINLRKRHLRPRRAGQKGQIATFPASLHISAVMLVCPSCSRATRVGRADRDGKKMRLCKKCGAGFV